MNWARERYPTTITGGIPVGILRTPILLSISAILILIATAWTFWPHEVPAVGKASALPVAKEVREVEKIVYRPKLVYVYPDRVKKKLNLPAPIVEDATKKVTATGKLNAEDRDYTMSAILDGDGNTEIYARPDPLPWIGPGRRGAVGVAYGLKDGHAAGQIYAYHDLLQIKALHAGVRGTVDTDHDYFAGGYVEWRF